MHSVLIDGPTILTDKAHITEVDYLTLKNWNEFTGTNARIIIDNSVGGAIELSHIPCAQQQDFYEAIAPQFGDPESEFDPTFEWIDRTQRDQRMVADLLDLDQTMVVSANLAEYSGLANAALNVHTKLWDQTTAKNLLADERFSFVTEFNIGHFNEILEYLSLIAGKIAVKAADHVDDGLFFGCQAQVRKLMHLVDSHVSEKSRVPQADCDHIAGAMYANTFNGYPVRILSRDRHHTKILNRITLLMHAVHERGPRHPALREGIEMYMGQFHAHPVERWTYDETVPEFRQIYSTHDLEVQPNQLQTSPSWNQNIDQYALAAARSLILLTTIYNLEQQGIRSWEGQSAIIEEEGLMDQAEYKQPFSQ